MGRSGDVDYVFLAKSGFLLGFGLFLIGAGGEAVGHTLVGSFPSWEETVLLNLEIVGLLVGFFSPIVFGIVLPLIE